MNCTYCDGRGEVAGTMPDGSWQTDPCPYCGGTGLTETHVPVRDWLAAARKLDAVPEVPKRKRGRQSLNAYRRGLTP